MILRRYPKQIRANSFKLILVRKFYQIKSRKTIIETKIFSHAECIHLKEEAYIITSQNYGEHFCNACYNLGAPCNQLLYLSHYYRWFLSFTEVSYKFNISSDLIKVWNWFEDTQQKAEIFFRSFTSITFQIWRFRCLNIIPTERTGQWENVYLKRITFFALLEAL